MLLSKTKSAELLENICGMSPSVQIGEKDECWLGVYTTKPSDDGTGGVECSGLNYSRVNISRFMDATDRSIVNVMDINFNAAVDPLNPTATTGADWGTLVAFGLFTDRTSGKAYAWGDLDESITVVTQNTLHFLAGDFEIFLDESTTAQASTT